MIIVYFQIYIHTLFIYILFTPGVLRHLFTAQLTPCCLHRDEWPDFMVRKVCCLCGDEIRGTPKNLPLDANGQKVLPPKCAARALAAGAPMSGLLHNEAGKWCLNAVSTELGTSYT